MKDVKSRTEHATLKMARKYFKRFGMKPVTVDKLDMWLIDNGLIDDPGTDDTTSIAWKGFIQQRSSARAALNLHARDCEEPFQILVKKAGKLYENRPYTEDVLQSARHLGQQVNSFLKGRTDKMDKNERKVLELLHWEQEFGTPERVAVLLETSKICAVVKAERSNYQKRLTAESAHLARGMELAEQAIAERMLQLGVDKNEDDDEEK